VHWTQLIFGVLLVIVLLGMAGYYGWRQVQALRDMRRGGDNLPVEDRRYARNMAWRRLLGSVLMLLFAGLLIGSFTLEEPAKELGEQGEAALANGEEFVPSQEQSDFRDFYVKYWIVALLVLLAIVTLAALDFFAIRRFGRRHYRQIQEDRRAMIEREVSRLRGQRNGYHY